jgi:YHS domain-containing protein
MTAWILRLILIVIVVRLLWRFARGVLEGAGMLQQSQQRGVGLVRDPVCGVFILPSKAVTAADRGETLYFCSEKCRREWVRR